MRRPPAGHQIFPPRLPNGSKDLHMDIRTYVHAVLFIYVHIYSFGENLNLMTTDKQHWWDITS